jgi:hypothetical protein
MAVVNSQSLRLTANDSSFRELTDCAPAILRKQHRVVRVLRDLEPAQARLLSDRNERRDTLAVSVAIAPYLSALPAPVLKTVRVVDVPPELARRE